MFKVDSKGILQECYSGVFIISLENIFDVWRSLIFVNHQILKYQWMSLWRILLLGKLQAFAVHDNEIELMAEPVFSFRLRRLCF